MKTTRSISVVVFAILAMAGILWMPCSVQAQAPAGGAFTLSQSVHWGSAVLPTGKYMYSVESGVGTPVVRVRQIGGSFTGMFVPQTSSRSSDSESGGIVLARIGEETFVASLPVHQWRLVLNFSTSNSEAEAPPQDSPQARYITISKNPTQGFFAILNPGDEKVSYVEAEKVYLSACETIEREFNLSTPIRPRLTVHLHSNENNLHYPERDLRLARWDKDRFAEAVVELVLHDMISPEDRLRLTRLAVAQAGATVSICELKDCKN